MASNSDFKKGPGTVGEEASAFGQRVKGAVKEGAGKLTGNERLEHEGRIENTAGNIRQSVNDVIDTDRDTIGNRSDASYGREPQFGSSFTNDQSLSQRQYGAGSGTVAEEASAFGQRVKGAVKEGAGKLTGNERLEYEGKLENTAGNIRQSMNDVIDTDRSRVSSTFDRVSGSSGSLSGSSTMGSSYAAKSSHGNLVTGVFHDRHEAERAWNDLKTRFGFKDSEISVMMSDTTRAQHYGDMKPGAEFAKGESRSLEGLGVGSALGGTLGAIIGAIAAIGTNLVIPGAGLVLAGPLAAAFAGAGLGGATGGLIGALVGAGIPEERAREYDEAIRSGGIVIGVHARDEKQAQELESYLRRHGADSTRR